MLTASWPLLHFLDCFVLLADVFYLKRDCILVQFYKFSFWIISLPGVTFNMKLIICCSCCSAICWWRDWFGFRFSLLVMSSQNRQASYETKFHFFFKNATVYLSKCYKFSFCIIGVDTFNMKIIICYAFLLRYLLVGGTHVDSGFPLRIMSAENEDKIPFFKWLFFLYFLNHSRWSSVKQFRNCIFTCFRRNLF